jgi:hypothetical protein
MMFILSNAFVPVRCLFLNLVLRRKEKKGQAEWPALLLSSGPVKANTHFSFFKVVFKIKVSPLFEREPEGSYL